MTKLKIETLDHASYKLILEVNGTISEKIIRSRSESLLFEISELFTFHGIKLSDLEEIEYNKAPYGSFTGLRITAAVAKTIAFLLDINVNGKSPEESQVEYLPSKFD